MCGVALAPQQLQDLQLCYSSSIVILLDKIIVLFAFLCLNNLNTSIIWFAMFCQTRSNLEQRSNTNKNSKCNWDELLRFLLVTTLRMEIKQINFANMGSLHCCVHYCLYLVKLEHSIQNTLLPVVSPLESAALFIPNRGATSCPDLSHQLAGPVSCPRI